MVTVIFFGEIAVGTTYPELLPAPSNPSGFPWIIQPDVISASIWARDHLGANQPFATDFVDSLALATYGDENTEPQEEIFAVFFGDSLAGLPAQLIKESGTRYILVDWRMTYGRRTTQVSTTSVSGSHRLVTIPKLSTGTTSRSSPRIHAAI